MRKRIGAFLLAGVMLLSLTGCGNNKADNYSKYVELGQYTGIEYTKAEVDVTDAEVQAEIDTFLANLSKTEEVTGRAVQKDDIVNIDYVGVVDGVEFDGGAAEGADLTIGSGQFIDGFEDGLIGHEIGEEVAVEVVFPDPYENNPDLAGKPATFNVTINSISVKNTPALTDALVKEETDYDTIEAYKESVKEKLLAEEQANAEIQEQSDIFNKVMANSKVTGFDEAEVKQLIDDEFKNFKDTASSYEAYGYSYEDILVANGYEDEEQLKEGIKEYVENYLTQKMIIYLIADAEGMNVTSDETDALVQEYMDSTGAATKEEVYDYYGDEYFELAILSEKVMKFLQENAVQVDATEAATEEATTEAE